MKVQLPWYGKASGRSAGTIYQSYWGATYTRSMPFSFHYPDTPDQQACQATFFDIQRPWIPIYNQIKDYLNKYQRKNVNPFNVYSMSIFKIFAPYGKDKYVEVPGKFGLDNLNSMWLELTSISMTITPEEVQLRYGLAGGAAPPDHPIKHIHFLLFNRTQQSMLFKSQTLMDPLGFMSFVNTNEWKNGDRIFLYVAVSADDWLGNFKLQTRWEDS